MMNKLAISISAVLRARESRKLKEGVTESAKTLSQLDNMKNLNKAMYEAIQHPMPIMTERGAELEGVRKALTAESSVVTDALKHYKLLQRNPDMKVMNPEALRQLFLNNPKYKQPGVLGWKRKNNLEGLLEENIRLHYKKLLDESNYTTPGI